MSYILCLERNHYSRVDVTQATDLLSFTDDSVSLVIFDFECCLYLYLTVLHLFINSFFYSIFLLTEDYLDYSDMKVNKT